MSIPPSTSLDEVYQTYGAALQATARRVLGNDDDAADCVHDVLLRVWQRDRTYRPERGSLRAYLVVAVRNEAVSRVRSARRHAELERFAAAGEPREYAIDMPDAVDVAKIRAAIAALPPEQRTALDLAYRGELTHTEIAARLGLPLGTVKSRLMLAMRKLTAAVQ